MTETWEDEGGSFIDDDEEPEDEWIDGEEWIEVDLESGWNNIDDVDDWKYVEDRI